ncbi:hypothetical protein NHX12_009855 [Muraenolepis orangiensis]|uniref:Uncharacterized protein n=1 Tax=Muraenolepis orangiensis TaxID=630683 RepID=A0A9Q0DHZ8_9TELE|nr:hypothetical protein NHX12_009855 [Muraenolepis orangiensis]
MMGEQDPNWSQKRAKRLRALVITLSFGRECCDQCYNDDQGRTGGLVGGDTHHILSIPEGRAELLLSHCSAACYLPLAGATPHAMVGHDWTPSY